VQTSLWPVAQIDQIWPSLREGFQKALFRSGGQLTTADLWIACRSGNAFLLIAHDGEKVWGASIWRPDTWQSGQKLRCLALYGTGFRGWIFDMKAMAVRVAQDCGANGLISDGRTGWARVFKNTRVICVTYEETI
jgi:hypothetical protein